MVTSVSLQTTVIGSFPKPPYLEIPDFFARGSKKPGLLGTNTDAYSKMMADLSEEQRAKLEVDIVRATKEVIEEQVACGVDVVTDGEVRRENYIHYFCRSIDGIDFEGRTEIQARNGAFTARVPTIRARVAWRGPLRCAEEWRAAQGVSPVPVKHTLPGPMTIIGSTADAHYGDDRALARDLAALVNRQVRELAAAGCRHVQLDEPLFARRPSEALAYGVDCLERCFEGCPAGVERIVHLCCGYPGYVDQVGYPKADKDAYRRLAPALDDSSVDTVSIEDASCRNDLSLLGLFQKTKVALGSIDVSSSRVESVGEIRARIEEALEHIAADRLIIAPDCGLALLDGDHRPTLNLKLANMCRAARCVSCAPGGRHSDDGPPAGSPPKKPRGP